MEECKLSEQSDNDQTTTKCSKCGKKLSIQYCPDCNMKYTKAGKAWYTEGVKDALVWVIASIAIITILIYVGYTMYQKYAYTDMEIRAIHVVRAVQSGLDNPESMQLHSIYVSKLTYTDKSPDSIKYNNGHDTNLCIYDIDLSAENEMGGMTRETYYIGVSPNEDMYISHFNEQGQETDYSQAWRDIAGNQGFIPLNADRMAEAANNK